MKKRLIFFIIVLFGTFFFAPIHCFAEASVKYTFHTYIDKWYKDDELLYHCSSYGEDHVITITAGNNYYHYDTCENIAINELLDGVHDLDTYIQNITIDEDVIVTDMEQDTAVIDSPYLELTDVDFNETLIKKRIFQNYHPGDYTVDIAAIKEKNPGYIWYDFSIYDSELCFIDLGIVDYPITFASYQFTVRGDLADPSGRFVLSFPEREALYYNSGDICDTRDVMNGYFSLKQLKELLEEKFGTAYIEVYNEQEYSVSYHLLNGEGLNAILPEPGYEEEKDYRVIPWGIYFEVEARNDSEIANTGLLYDIGPYVLLGIVLIGFFLVFQKNKIKEEQEENFEELH